MTQSLEAEARTHRPIDAEALRSLEEVLSRPTLAKDLLITAQDQIWQWIENSVGMIVNLKHAGAQGMSFSKSKSNCFERGCHSFTIAS